MAKSKIKKEANPTKVIVGFPQAVHDAMADFQEAVRLDGSKKMSKNDITNLVFSEVGLKFLQAESKRLRAEYKASL